MKSIQINSVCGYGSTGQISVYISKLLSSNNIENYVMYGVWDSDFENGIKFGNQINVRSHQIKTRLLGKHGFYSKRATKKLIDKIIDIDPDLIHLQNIHGHYLNVELLFEYLSKSGKPVIWSIHDCWSFTGHCAHFDYIGCEKWKTGCFDCPQLLEYPKSLIFDRSKESYRDKKRLFTSVKDLTIITTSDWIDGLVKQSFLKDLSTVIIKDGIDLDVFKPTDSNFRQENNLEDKFIILGVANLWLKKKGYDYFLELASKIKQDEIIVLVGVTKDQKEDLPKNIVGITRTDSVKELVGIYSAADVFLNPTLEEVFGLVNMESLACGTPVVTFNTGGSPEAIDENTGLVVERDDLEAMIKAKDEIKLMGKSYYEKHCIERVKSNFDKVEKYNEYIDLYNDLVKHDNRRR